MGEPYLSEVIYVMFRAVYYVSNNYSSLKRVIFAKSYNDAAPIGRTSDIDSRYTKSNLRDST